MLLWVIARVKVHKMRRGEDGRGRCIAIDLYETEREEKGWFVKFCGKCEVGKHRREVVNGIIKFSFKNKGVKS